MAQTKKKTEQIELEAALSRLDQVVAAISAEGVELEKALSLYEEGVSLVKICTARLEEAQRKITLLRTNGDGEVSETPFDAPIAD